jgi:hypothetical protein
MRFTQKGSITIAFSLIIWTAYHFSLASDILYLPKPGKVAFIGNSLTLTNGGSDNIVKRIGDAMTPPLQLTINKEIQTGGCYLSCHWSDTSKIAIVAQGHFDMVVLQEGGDLTNSTSSADAEQFYHFAQRWADTIRTSGATPVLYMMWAWREDTGAAMLIKTNHHAAEYDSAARLIRAKVIPIGRGYYKLRNDTSQIAKSINLFTDYQHPTCCATYFIGCICFSALYGISPIGNAYLGGDLGDSASVPTPEQARALQRIAWNTWLEYGGSDSGRGYISSNVITTKKYSGPVVFAKNKIPNIVIGSPDACAPCAWYMLNGAHIPPTAMRQQAGRKSFHGIFVSVPERNPLR